MSVQQQFAEKVASLVKHDPSVIGLAVGGSWLSNEIDEFSDLDLVLVTKEKISHNKAEMLAYASRFGELLNAFTGEHVGEPRLLICLYDNPLLHVDIKFLVLEEFSTRVEDPFILADTNGQLQQSILASSAKFPYPDYQWIEDRFWIWIHYILLKIGRGEYFEAFDSLGFLRSLVFGPLVHIKNENLPRGMRRIEQVNKTDLDALRSTIAIYDRSSLIKALENCITIYQDLQEKLYDDTIIRRVKTQKRVLEFFQEIKQ
jgi:hypothetical protein